MSKILKPIVYVDEKVSSIDIAKHYADKAQKAGERLKSELWGLVMCTPKDVTAEGEDPIANVKEKFDEIMDELWEAFVDDYKYTIIADDASYNENSLVTEAWEEELKDIEEMKLENERRKKFFEDYGLDRNNFDDYTIYQEWRDHQITIDSKPLTKECRDQILADIRHREEIEIQKALETISQTINKEDKENCNE